MKSLFKRLDTSGHFPDFKHTAKGQRDNKKIRARKERRMLKEQEAEPLSHMTDDSDLYFTCGKCGHVIWSEDYKFCPMCATRIAWNGGRYVK